MYLDAVSCHLTGKFSEELENHHVVKDWQPGIVLEWIILINEFGVPNYDYRWIWYLLNNEYG